MAENKPHSQSLTGHESAMSDTESLAGLQLDFAPEYFGVSNGVTKEEAGQAAEELEAWIDSCMQQRPDEIKAYDAGPRYPSPEEMSQGVKTDKKLYPTRFITRGKDFADGSTLRVTLIKREEAIGDAHDDLRGSLVGVSVRLGHIFKPKDRGLIYRLEGDPKVLHREEQNEFVTPEGWTIPRLTDKELAEKAAQGLADQMCGLNELAGLRGLFDDEELPKTDNFFGHDYASQLLTPQSS